MAIVALKLVSGEELVVDVSSETKTTIEFTNPVATVMQRRQEGPVLGFMPWMQSSNGPFVVSKDKIICSVDVADEVKNGYNQIFGAGIVVPPQQLITG